MRHADGCGEGRQGDELRDGAPSDGRGQAAARPPEVIVLPELWSTGYALESAGELASPMGEEEAAFLGELAARHHVAFAGGSVLSLRDGRVYNRAQIIDREGRYAARGMTRFICSG